MRPNATARGLNGNVTRLYGVFYLQTYLERSHFTFRADHAALHHDHASVGHDIKSCRRYRLASLSGELELGAFSTSLRAHHEEDKPFGLQALGARHIPLVHQTILASAFPLLFRTENIGDVIQSRFGSELSHNVTRRESKPRRN